MEKVAGIGGFFFRAHDPKALGQWYQQHLGGLAHTIERGRKRLAARGRANLVQSLSRDEQIFRGP